MFTTKPNAADPTRLTLVRGAYRAFDEHSPLAAEPALPGYLADMGRPFGVRPHAAPFTSGHSHGEMAEPLIEALADQQPIDVLVLAQRMHDVRPGRATATYLASRCAGAPLAFAVCDQGAAAPFTALRLLDSYARSGVCARALLLVVEQATLHYEPVTPVRLPDRHTAVALLLEAGSTATITVRQQVGVAEDQVTSALDAEVTSLCAGHPDPVVLSGSAGLPLTGLWWELAAGLDTWAGRRVVLADHDPTVGLLSVAAIDLGER
jgi:4-hydroxymandelate oxidase